MGMVITVFRWVEEISFMLVSLNEGEILYVCGEHVNAVDRMFEKWIVM